MELKRLRTVLVIGFLPSSNRTFMELKQRKEYGAIIFTVVLIVPLWN